MPEIRSTNLDKIRSDVSELQKSTAQISVLVEKMDTTIEKLTDLSSNVTSLLAVHEQRLAYNEQTKDNMYEVVTQNKIETTEKIKEVSSTVEKNKDILLSKFDSFSEKMEEKMNHLQKYIWLAAGGGAVIIWVLQYGYYALNLASKIH